MGFVWNTIHSSIQVPAISLSITMPIQKKVFYLGCSLYLYCHKCIFISYFLLFTSMPPLLLMLLYLCHMSLPNPMHPFSFQYPWSNLIYSLPFHYLSIAFSKVWSDVHLSIVPSHFLSFSCFHSILLSSLSHHHPILSDSKSCADLFSYSHYLCSI